LQHGSSSNNSSTRPSDIRRGQDPASPAEQRFQDHLSKAIDFYQKAIALDPDYALADSNLGAALLLREDVKGAIGRLEHALKSESKYPESLNNLGIAFALNNLGVALLMEGSPDKGRMYLTKAHELAPVYDAPLFNLGKLAYDEGNRDAALRYWKAYAQLDSTSNWTEAIRQALGLQQPDPPLLSASKPEEERLLGVPVHEFQDKIPPDWGQPKSHELSVGGQHFTVVEYPNRLAVLLHDEQIILITVLEGFQGRSARGAALGSEEAEVRAQYGTPSQIMPLTQGVSWMYEASGITFQLRDGRVVAWQVF
jgi:tetratricopeptide (TPR) repeat protein